MPTMDSRHHTPGELLVCADWAIAHGDADGLAHAIRELGDCMSGRFTERLRALSRLCIADYNEASSRWPAVKDDIRAELASVHN
jgi:hypothetical protein